MTTCDWVDGTRECPRPATRAVRFAGCPEPLHYCDPHYDGEDRRRMPVVEEWPVNPEPVDLTGLAALNTRRTGGHDG